MVKLFNVETSSNSVDFCKLMNVTQLQNRGITGKDVTIAVIDTGCSNHDLLKNKIIGGKNFTKEGNSRDFTDNNGHGTHVAGIISAEKNPCFTSVAPDSKLLICKVLDKNGNGTLEDVAKAVKYATSKKVDIINMSLGSTQGSEDLHKAIQKAVKSGITVVCASGNSGDANANTDEVMYPAVYEEVVEVGAMGADFKVSRFSNSNKYIDLLALGESILSTYLDNNFKSLSGTSMATPMVTGALALLLQYAKQTFGRTPTEKELYGLLIKNTKSLGLSRTLEGNGYVYIK